MKIDAMQAPYNVSVTQFPAWFEVCQQAIAGQSN